MSSGEDSEIHAGIYGNERIKNMSSREHKELSVTLVRTQQHKKEEMGYGADFFFFFFLGLKHTPSMPDIVEETDGMADAVKEK